MYRVTTSRLGPDGRRINPASEDTDRGEMSAADLTILLDAFVEIDPADNEEHDPHIVVAGRGAKLIIRTSRGRLQVYDVRDHAAPAVEMTVAGIIERLDLVETSSPFPGPTRPRPRADGAPPRHRLRDALRRARAQRLHPLLGLLRREREQEGRGEAHHRRGRGEGEGGRACGNLRDGPKTATA
jgi:hypothetical protein